MAAEHDQRESPFETSSGLPVKRCYGSEDLEQVGPEQDIGQPGEFPYTRGIHPDMYRGKVWTKRVYVGFGKTENTNDRLRYLLSRGSTGLIIVPDAPAMMGIDADHPLAHGNVGVIGFPFSSLRDMEKIFHSIPLDQFSISMQWTSCATPAGFGAYLAMAEKRGVPWHCLRGSIYVESLTCRLEEEAQRIMGDIDRLGGMVSALRKGWVQEQVRQEALRKQGQVESGERRVVGVNCYAVPSEQEVPIPIVKDKRLPELSLEQEAALTSLKRERDSLRWRRSLEELRRLAEAGEEVNLLPAIMDALKADATAGEIAGTIREAYGLSYDPLNVLSSPLKG